MRKYPKYKISQIEYLGSLPENWELWKFKRLTKILTCGYASTPQYVDENVGVAFLSAQNVKPGRIVLDKFSYITKELHSELTKNKQAKNGDVLIARVGGEGNIGDAAIVNVDFDFSVYVSLAHIRTRKNLSNKFLVYFFQTDYAKLLSKIETQVGGGVGNLNVKDMERYKIPTPSLPEQHAIVRFLDYKTGQIDSFIVNRQKQIELLKEQKAGIINKAVTKGINPDAKMKDSGIEWIERIPENWNVWKLKFLTKRISKGTTPSTEGREILEVGAIRFLKAENITPEGISLLPEFFIDEETNQILKRSQLQKNDILFVIAGATIGKAAIIDDDFIPANTNQAVCFIRLKNKVLPELILNQLQASYVKNIMAVESVVAAQPNISMENIGNFQIFLPPMEEQKKLLKFIKDEANNFDTLICKYQKQIDLMQEYRTSLISQAVTGKIDVRDWQPKKQQKA